MVGPDPDFPEAWQTIPDPARDVGSRRTAPMPVVPDEPSPTRADRRRRALFAAIFALAWVLAPIVAFHPRHDLGTPGVLVPIALWSATSAIALLFALRPDKRGLPIGVGAIRLLIPGVLIAFLAAVIAVSAGAAEVPIHLTAWTGGAGCFTIATLVGLGPLLLAAPVLRRAFPSAPALRGAAVGVVAGLIGAIGVHFLCSLQARGHLIVTHGAPILLLTLAGAALGAIGGRP